MVKNKSKKHIVIWSVIIFLLVVAVVVGIVLFNIYNRKLEYKKSVSIKIGDELPTINDYVDDKELERLDNKEINWNDIPLEENKVYNAGKYTGYIKFRDDKLEIKVEVIDDEAPSIEGVSDITIYVNEEVDLIKNITTNDNSHDEVSLNINGEYSTSQVGEYSLSYVATDKSGNETVMEFKLIVNEKEVPKTTYTPSTNTETTVTENVVIGTSSNGYTIKRVNGIYYVDGVLIANKTYSLPSSYAPGGMLNSFMTPFYSMQSDALSQGISLSIISGYRSYSRQNNTYNNYVARDGKALADTYSARPGHSEHQTGLAADINSLDQSWINTAEGQWLNNNCYKYGFIIRYPQGKESITGYMYEPWHIRYVGVELATKLYNNGNWLSLEEYLGITSTYSY